MTSRLALGSFAIIAAFLLVMGGLTSVVVNQTQMYSPARAIPLPRIGEVERVAPNPPVTPKSTPQPTPDPGKNLKPKPTCALMGIAIKVTGFAMMVSTTGEGGLVIGDISNRVVLMGLERNIVRVAGNFMGDGTQFLAMQMARNEFEALLKASAPGTAAWEVIKGRVIAAGSGAVTYTQSQAKSWTGVTRPEGCAVSR